jgi:hypothetical protein
MRLPGNSSKQVPVTETIEGKRYSFSFIFLPAGTGAGTAFYHALPENFVKIYFVWNYDMLKRFTRVALILDTSNPLNKCERAYSDTWHCT